MHAENDREFELVLGNKQLLGLLFVTFVLLGVFFALGYAMGRNTVPSPVVETQRSADAPPPEPKPSVTENPAVTERPSPVEPASAAIPPAQRAPEPAVAGVIIDPKPGETFLQVGAVKRREAESLVEVLSNKGFKAVLAPAPPPLEDTFRVLVGPIGTDIEQGKLKTELERAGFKPIPRRY